VPRMRQVGVGRVEVEFGHGRTAALRAAVGELQMEARRGAAKTSSAPTGWGNIPPPPRAVEGARRTAEWVRRKSREMLRRAGARGLAQGLLSAYPGAWPSVRRVVVHMLCTGRRGGVPRREARPLCFAAGAVRRAA
jgi:hypothetical protein